MVKITNVEENSLAHQAGILPSDYLISINGNEINDILDYNFYLAEKKITLKIHRWEELFDIIIKKNDNAVICDTLKTTCPSLSSFYCLAITQQG